MISNNDCENLDAYLADELPACAAQRFAAHVESCEICRESVHQQQWIDGLLRAPALAELELPAREFTNSLKSTLAQSRQRAGLVACVFAAAAALLITLGWAVSVLRNADVALEQSSGHGNQDANIAAPATNIVAAPRATVIGDANTFVVPVESPLPNVTIVRIYPTDQALFAANANDAPAETGGNFAWPDNTNGG